MVAAVETFRCVICHRCGESIRVPRKLETRQVSKTPNDFESQVFVLRCHECRRESTYAIREIADYEYEKAKGSRGLKRRPGGEIAVFGPSE
jgi:hypothetical protein